MKADRHQCEGHAETYRKDRTAPFPVFHPAVVHNQSLDAVEQRLDEKRQDQADQQRGKQVRPAEMADGDQNTLPDEFGGSRADSYPDRGGQHPADGQEWSTTECHRI